MQFRYDYGDAVRVTRNVRNDGTYPGMEVGNLLVRRGSMGYVVNVGTFLQDQIIYTVHFLDAGRMVGCREEELIPGDEPWTPSRFEFRDKVISRLSLSLDGEIVVNQGAEGQVLKVLRDDPENVRYHINFPGGLMLIVPETALEAPATEDDTESVED
jgi:nitrogen fixation protein NifZ